MNNRQSQTPTRKSTKQSGSGGSSPLRRSPSKPRASSSSPSSSRNLIRTFFTLGIGIGIGAITAYTLSSVIKNENELRYLSAVNFDEKYVELQTLLHNTSIASLADAVASTIAGEIPEATSESLSSIATNINDATTTTSASESRKQATTTLDDTTEMSVDNIDVPKVVSSTSVVEQPKEETTTTTKTAATPPAATPIDLQEKKVYKEFEHVDGGVIVTKIHSDMHLGPLEQSLCLLHYAYNNRVLYDVIVFTALNITDERFEPIRKVIAPAKLTVLMDNPGLQKMIRGLSPAQKSKLLRQTNTSKLEDIQWGSKITDFAEDGVKQTTNAIQYNWQAEFRSLHLWTHPVLKPYRYMLWMDTDGFCTRKWDRDPVAIMANNDLAIAFNNFPMGRSTGSAFQERYKKAFNTTLCEIKMIDGHLEARRGPCKTANPAIAQIHGYFHVTDLDFYRSEPVMHWFRTLIGDTKFSRNFDDQIAVTVPAAMLAPAKSWHMPSNGMHLKIFHNFVMDGVGQNRVGGFKNWWKKNGTQFPEAHGICRVVNAGR